MRKTSVFMSIRATQRIPGEDPETMELQTDGTMAVYPDRVEFSYVETEMTGMAGVVTTFRIFGPERIVLLRSGERLHNEMIFTLGEKHDSLYEMDMGALLLTVEASRIRLQPEERYFEVEYTVAVEHTTMGTNTYRVEYRPV